MSDDDKSSERRQRKLKAARDGASPFAKFDLATTEFVEPVTDTLPMKLLSTVGELANQSPLNAAGIAATLGGIAADDARLRNTGLRILAAHAVATGIKGILKGVVRRTRPWQAAKDGDHEAEISTDGGKEYQSFPSGHTAGAVATARVVASAYPEASLPAYGAAAFAAAIQIPEQGHYPTDVAAGILIGLLSAEVGDALVAAAAGEVERRDL